MISLFVLDEVVEGTEGVFAVGYQVLWPCGTESEDMDYVLRGRARVWMIL